MAAAFGVGIWIGAHAANMDTGLFRVGILCGAVLCLISALTGKRLVLGCAFLFLFVGALYANRTVSVQLPPGGKYQVTGTVKGESLRREEDGRIRAVLRDVELRNAQGTGHHVPSAWWTYYPAMDAPLPVDGQQVQMQSTLYHPSPAMNPYGFDFRLYLLQKGISVGLSGARNLEFVPAHPAVATDGWLCLRNTLNGLLDQAMGMDSALPKGLLFGDTSSIEEQTSRSFRDAGIAHVLSVSGLHIGILAMALVFIMRWLNLSPRVQFGVLLVVLLLYCRLLEFAAPVVRASILTFVLFGARLLHERSDPLTSLSFAFLMILAFRPLDLFHVGFQLSFLAVAGIFLLGSRLQHNAEAWLQKHKAPRWVKSVAASYAITLSASLFTAPVVAGTFHRLSLIGLLFNPLACLLVGVLMTGSLVVLVMSALSLPLAQAAAQPLIWLVRLFNALTGWAAAAPFATIRTAAPTAAVMVFIFVCLFMLTRYTRYRGWKRFVLPGIAGLLVLVLFLVQPKDALRYTQFSVGAGDAAIVEDGKHSYVIDTGPDGTEIAVYLLSTGRRADALFITHLHADHAGGLACLLDEGIPLDALYISPLAAQAPAEDPVGQQIARAADGGTVVHVLAAGDQVQIGRMEVEVLWPHANRTHSAMEENDRSLALLLTLDDLCLFTAGDLTADYEVYAASPAHVFKAGHHGSAGSNSQALLSAVSPQIALLSASGAQEERATGFIRDLKERQIKLLSTATGGAIRLSVHPGGVVTEQYLMGGFR
jgi:competence protein ComEC